MATGLTQLQAIALLRDLLARAGDGIASDLPISAEITQAMDATAHLVDDPDDALSVAAPTQCANCEFGAAHHPACPRVIAPAAVRDRFERHMVARDKAVMLERRADGSYASWFTDRYWTTWIAAWEASKEAGADETLRLNWLDENIFHREMDDWDKKRNADSEMWVLFAPKGTQGTARRILDASRARESDERANLAASGAEP